MLKKMFSGRRGRAVAATVIAASLPLLFIGANLDVLVNSGWLYSYNWWRNDVSTRTGLEKSELDRASRTIKEYFAAPQSDELLDVRVRFGSTDVSVYKPREVEHMRDVKGLLRGFLAAGLWSGVAIVATAALVLAVLKPKGWALLASAVKWSAVASMAVVVVIGVASLINFGAVFTVFHQLGFSNDLWQLSSSDYLILMFPEQFWFEAVLLLGVLIAAEFAGMWLATRWLARRYAG